MPLVTLALLCFGFSTPEPIQLAPDPYPSTFLSAEAKNTKEEAASPYTTHSPNISTEQALLIAGHHDQADPIPTPGIALAEPFANAGHVHPAPPARSKPALRAPPPGKSHQTNATPVVYARFELDSPVAPNNAPTDLARQLGRAGEDAAGIVQGAKQRIPSVTRPGRHRVPDELNEVTLREIKNVANQSNTSQLRDFLEYAKNTNRTFILETRATTKISGPLQKLIDQGRIVHRVIGE